MQELILVFAIATTNSKMITSPASVTSYDELPRRKFMAIDLYQWQGFWYFLTLKLSY